MVFGSISFNFSLFPILNFSFQIPLFFFVSWPSWAHVFFGGRGGGLDNDSCNKRLTELKFWPQAALIGI